MLDLAELVETGVFGALFEALEGVLLLLQLRLSAEVEALTPDASNQAGSLDPLREAAEQAGIGFISGFVYFNSHHRQKRL